MVSSPQLRGRIRSVSRSPPSRLDHSRSPPPPARRRHGSRSPSLTPVPRRNGRQRSGSRSWSRDRGRDSRSPAENPLAKSTKIVVERLSKNITEDHLYEIFGQFGHVKDLDLPINRIFGTNRGTAYILYDYEADAEAAIAHMHEAQVDGTVINVSIVLQRQKLSPAPPMARRGANIDPRVSFSGPRAGGPPSVSAAAGGVSGGRRRLSPSSRYGPRSDAYRPTSRSLSRSPGGAAPPSRGGGASRYRSRSNGSYSSPSRTRSPAPRRRGGGGGGGRGGRRSRSRSADSGRSRSRSRGRGYR